MKIILLHEDALQSKYLESMDIAVASGAVATKDGDMANGYTSETFSIVE